MFLFTLPDSDTDSNSDSDYKPNGYVTLCGMIHSYCTESDSDSSPNYQTIVMGSESDSVLESGSVNVNKPLNGQARELKTDVKQ